MAYKEELVEVKKAWGKEIVVVNREYCGKLLCIDKGARSSLHSHPTKRETMYCLCGTVSLTSGGKDYLLTSVSRPKTIEPGEYHSFYGVTKAIILEVSTHDDGEVERLNQSEPGEEHEEFVLYC